MAFAGDVGLENKSVIHQVEEQAHVGMDFTQAEEKQLVRKIDLFLLPTIWLMYLLSYIDRTKYAFTQICLATPEYARC